MKRAQALPHTGSPSGTLAYQGRVLRVVAGTEFKVKYAESLLGYVWSVLKPLALFSVLYVVFGRFFKLNIGFEHYPLYLLTGLVLWTFFADAIAVALPSVVARGSLLRKLAFPRVVIPVSATVTAALTFAINLGVVAVFLAFNRVAPRVEWLLLAPLLLELYAFVLGLSLALSALHVRFRDIGQIWELGAQLLFWASPIIYPVGFLPPWALPVAFLNPFVQVMQDVRQVLFASNEPVVTDVLGSAGRLAPLAVVAATLALGLVLFRRDEQWFAERV